MSEMLKPCHETLVDDIDWIANSGDVQTRNIGGEWKCGTRSYELQNVCSAARAYLRMIRSHDESMVLDRESIKRGMIKAACWQNKEECNCDHAEGAESAFDWLVEQGYLISAIPEDRG